MKRAFQIGTAYLVLALGIGVFIHGIYLNYYFASTSPREPKPATGEIFRSQMNKGGDIYLTEWEYYWTHIGVMCVTVVFVFLAHHLNKKWRAIPDQPQLPQKLPRY